MRKACLTPTLLYQNQLISAAFFPGAEIAEKSGAVGVNFADVAMYTAFNTLLSQMHEQGFGEHATPYGLMKRGTRLELVLFLMTLNQTFEPNSAPLLDYEIVAVNAYIDNNFQVPEDRNLDQPGIIGEDYRPRDGMAELGLSTMQVFAELASRLPKFDFVLLDGMPAEMAQGFGYESVGLVHDICCGSWTACRTIVSVPETGGDGEDDLTIMYDPMYAVPLFAAAMAAGVVVACGVICAVRYGIRSPIIISMPEE
jgi:hypothetical protein